MRSYVILAFLVLKVTTLSATQWQVGPSETYTAPSQVSTLVSAGDTVNIMAGIYPSDVARWSANDLLLRGVGGMAHLESNGLAWGGKGIWVIQGDRTTVEYIEFSECSVPDENGAGIRQEGHDLTVRNCYFHDNENGILAGTVNPSVILIEYTEFGNNGSGDGQSHNLYINNIDSLIFRYNYSHHAHVGHELKSRAHVNVIEYNRFSNEAEGDASRELDLPNGGTTYLIGNVIQQGPLGQNSNLVGFGLEGLSNPTPHALYAINNTLVNEKTVGSFFSVPSTVLFKAYANILAGGGSYLATGFPTMTDTLGNLRMQSIAAVDFLSPSNYDYRISNSSPANAVGYPAGIAPSGYPLVAWDEYVHPTSRTTRCQHATLAAGAFEACTTVRVEEQLNHDLNVWPIPASNAITVDLDALSDPTLRLDDAQGRTVLIRRNVRGTTQLDLGPFAPGVYTLHVTSGDRNFAQRIVKE